ncbi:hypothetical protein TNCV_2295931 [Trichonephila clavipes]|nr:hypothetical protein TNCV_2295931 [Trichonephila clavipes]
MGFSVSHGSQTTARLESRAPTIRRERPRSLRGRQTRDQSNRCRVIENEVEKLYEAFLREQISDKSGRVTLNEILDLPRRRMVAAFRL